MSRDIESAMSAAMALQVLDGKPGFKIQPEDRDRLVMAQDVNRLRELIQCEAILLDAWARESREGGWSTHQVDPMRNRADELRRLVHGA